MSLIHSIIKFIPKRIKREIERPFKEELKQINGCFSQEGEDLILYRLLSDWNLGVYLDIGAHHPHRFSNTNMLHLQGWTGINIDANPWSIDQFEKYRPKDLNLNYVLDDAERNIEYYLFNEPAINTCDYEKAQSIIKNTNYKLIETREVSSKTFTELYEKFETTFQKVVLLNLDIEGFDLKILKSINWGVFFPEIVIVEGDVTTIFECQADEINQLMIHNGYLLFSKLFRSRIYISKKFYQEKIAL
jgi:FkbM family methyltransferase